MHIQNIHFFKLIISLILLGFAIHFFSLGSSNISGLINVHNYKEVVKLKKTIKNVKISEKEKSSENLTPKIIEDESYNIFDQQNIIEQKIPEAINKNKIESIIVKKGETYDSILRNQPINKQLIQNIINATEKVFNLRKLNVGQELTFHYEYINENDLHLKKIIIPKTFREEIVIEKINENFIAEVINLPIISERTYKSAVIKKSLYEAGNVGKVPNAILMDLIRLYSFDVDFQRDIRVEDAFTIYYQTYYNDQKREVAYGDILYANLTLQGKEIEYFLFETKDGFDYYNRKGKNVRKALMKTPLDGARISSNFGMRKHPILGYNTMHKGVDFAAPRGTPVFAAGNGTIEYAGTNGAYGKYIRIRHNSSYKTAYAHLNGFKKGISKGKRVKQGEIIAYVGSTGRSTGPHLHYEVIFEGKKINPVKMKLPSGKALKGEELKKFISYSSVIYSEILEKTN